MGNTNGQPPPPQDQVRTSILSPPPGTRSEHLNPPPQPGQNISPPPGTTHRQAVCILLECILVFRLIILRELKTLQTRIMHLLCLVRARCRTNCGLNPNPSDCHSRLFIIELEIMTVGIRGFTMSKQLTPGPLIPSPTLTSLD